MAPVGAARSLLPHPSAAALPFWCRQQGGLMMARNLSSSGSGSGNIKPPLPRALSAQAASPPTALSASGRLGTEPPSPTQPSSPAVETEVPRNVLDYTEIEPRGVVDYVERAREMIGAVGDRGPPRWFTPLDCDGGGRLEGAPLLLYLPGIDGVGLGLIRHHQRLKRMFDIWCLHIPVMDRTPFEGLVEYVEMSLRSQNAHLQNKPIYLVGESLGACVALVVAARNPDIDFVIVLANPATSFGKSPLQHLLSFSDILPAIPSFFSSTGTSTRTLAYIEKGMQQTFGRLQGGFSTTSSYLYFLADSLPRDSLIWKLKLLKAASLFANSRLHAVRAQILILASGKDRLFPNCEEAERICNLLPRCRIRFFKDSDHSLLLEGSVDLVSIIKGAGFYRRSGQIDYVSDYLLPTPEEFKKAVGQYRWVSDITSPVMLSTLADGKIVRGLQGIPIEGPAIFVGYHSLLGWELGPMVTEFVTKRNILLRGIAHPFMFSKKAELLMPDPAAFDYVKIMGAVPVSGVNFYKLLLKKSFVLLYPGGVREALHRKGEEYKLFWPEQSEIVRMAANFGATIIPFGVVGEDDISEILFDYDDLLKVPFYDNFVESLNQGVERLRTDTSGELNNQDLHLPGIVPKVPGRYYYLFGRPFETKGRKLELKGREEAQKFYLDVKSEVERCLTYLKEKRETDPYRHLLPRLLYQATEGFTSEIPTFKL